MKDINQLNARGNLVGEIDFISVVRILHKRRIKLLFILLLSLLIGIILTILRHDEYTASTTMVPQVGSSSDNLKEISSLASIAGFNLNMNSSGFDISPVLFPKIVESTSFQLELMRTEFKFEEADRKLTLLEYYTDYYANGILKRIKRRTNSLLNSSERENFAEEFKVGNYRGKHSEIIELTKEQNNLSKLLKNKIVLTVNDKNGYLRLQAKFHQAGLSAQIVEKARELLQKYVILLKSEKAKEQYSFIKELYNEKKNEYNLAQMKLAEFRDANRSINSAMLRTEEEQLENEYKLAFEVFSEMATRLEQAKIKVKEDTPIFSVIQKVVVPVEKSKPQWTLVIVIWFVLGVLVGILGILGTFFYTSIKERLRDI